VEQLNSWKAGFLGSNESYFLSAATGFPHRGVMDPFITSIYMGFSMISPEKSSHKNCMFHDFPVYFPIQVHFQSLANFAARHALKLDLPSLLLGSAWMRCHGVTDRAVTVGHEYHGGHHAKYNKDDPKKGMYIYI
jgi:hypothetical protein